MRNECKPEWNENERHMILKERVRDRLQHGRNRLEPRFKNSVCIRRTEDHQTHIPGCVMES